MNKTTKNRLYLNYDVNSTLVIIAIVVGVMARFLVMCLGYNFDFDSYKVVGEIVSRGGAMFMRKLQDTIIALSFL